MAASEGEAHVDVVIVGAGIGGAVVALDLGRRGWRVALVEREGALSRIARPEILWGATLRALERYDVAEAIRTTASVRLDSFEIGGDTPWLRITRDDFAAAGVEAFSTHPSMTRSIIADAAVATGNVEIHRGVTVGDLLAEGDRITGVRGKRGDTELAFKARLVIGDDGGNSVVRTRLGIPIALETFPIAFVTGVITHWPLSPQRVRGWIQPKAVVDGVPVAVLIPWPADEGVLLMPLRRDRAIRVLEQSPETFWSAMERVTPMAGVLREQLQFPRDFFRVERPFGHAVSYVANGGALIGDAIHPMTPAGGQGANASIWDAFALADIAHAALRTGEASYERLLAYERLRYPFNDASLSFSRVAHRILGLGRILPLPIVLQVVARAIDALGWPKRKILRSFATTFVHSREESRS